MIIEYEDFISLLKDMYATIDSGMVLSSAMVVQDFSNGIKYGWRCERSGRTWIINRMRVKNYLEQHQDDVLGQLLRTAIDGGTESRLQLVQDPALKKEVFRLIKLIAFL